MLYQTALEQIPILILSFWSFLFNAHGEATPRLQWALPNTPCDNSTVKHLLFCLLKIIE